jgi:hypothetical protein
VRKLHTALGSIGALAAILGLAVAPAGASTHKTHSRAAAVHKIAPLRVTASVSPGRISSAPYAYTVSGEVRGPVICPPGAKNPSYCSTAPCQGRVSITINLPQGQTLIVEEALSDACDFTSEITIPSMSFQLKPRTKHHVFKIAFRVRYLGNAVLSAKSAPPVHAKAVGFHA